MGSYYWHRWVLMIAAYKWTQGRIRPAWSDSRQLLAAVLHSSAKPNEASE